MKNLFKLLTPFILAVLLLSCEAERTATHSGTKRFNSEKVSLQQFLQETQIKKFEASIRLDSNLQNKAGGVDNEWTDFDIDTDIIKKMEYHQKTTYSFVATPKNTIAENYFNLIYYKNGTTWEKKIIELKPNPDNLIQLKSGLTENFEGQMRMVCNAKLLKSSGDCTYIIIPTQRCQGCKESCDHCELCTVSMTYIFCNSNIEFISATPSAPSGINGGDGGGGGANDDPNEIVIDPNLFNLDLNKINLFLTNLRTTNLSAYNYFNSHTEIKNQVMSYLFANYFSEESTIFANQIIIKMKQNPTLYTSIKPFLIEKNIDDSQLDPCSKGVFQEIKNTTNCDFANVLAKLGANGTIYNTTMKTAHNNYTDPNGNIVQVSDPANTTRTTQGTKYDYTIFVNPDFQDKTKLYIATFLLHEVAHAYFFALLDDYTSGVTNSFYELPLLYNAFNTHSSNFNAALTHEEIANSYVNAIAAALKEFQPGLPQQVYDDMAWSGLEGTSIFNVRHPQGSASRQRILNRKAAEQTGHPVGQGTSQEQTNYGQPCN